MDGKIKFLTILLAALLVSAATSYSTTSLASLPAQSFGTGTVNVDVNNLPSDMVEQISDDIILELTKQNVSLPFAFKSYGGNESYVEVLSNIALENLTVTFSYNSTVDGTLKVESFDYGTYIPAWGNGQIITYGDIPGLYYRVPFSVVEQCPTTTMTFSGRTSDTVPQLEIVGVFGYA